jgi:hypothetical protein
MKNGENHNDVTLITSQETDVKIYFGGVTAEQYQQWADQFHGKILDITVIHPISKQQLGCYLKPMGRNELSMALTFQTNKQLLEGGEVILENCWLGGNEKLRNPGTDVFDQQAASAAAMQAWKNLTLAEAKAIKNG